MAGLVLIDKAPRAISDDSKALINEMIKRKIIKVAIVNSDDEKNHAQAFLQKMHSMRQDLTTSSKAKQMAERLEKSIRDDRSAFSLTQARECPQVVMDLL